MLNKFRQLFIGSMTGDIESDLPVSKSPLKPCPFSPNCIIVSKSVKRDSQELFADAKNALTGAGAESVNPKSADLKIDALFRIPVFGFNDDITIQIEENDHDSILHIRSASRVGFGDLGVNRRRVQRILSQLGIS